LYFWEDSIKHYSLQKPAKGLIVTFSRVDFKTHYDGCTCFRAHHGAQ